MVAIGENISASSEDTLLVEYGFSANLKRLASRSRCFK